MPVKVRCPECEKVLNAPDAARGKAVKCPGCQARVPVPAGEAEGTAKPAAKTAVQTAAKAAARKQAVSASAPNSEDSIMAMDLSRMEDRKARVCFKCGHDLQYLDEEESECPKCGTDQDTGGLGEKARKKQMVGLDPNDYYKGLWGEGIKFVKKNLSMALRTVAYMLVDSVLLFFCLFMFLYNYATPPRVFCGFTAAVCAFMIPGWAWYLYTVVVNMALERKDKFKRTNFDFFLSSALGFKCLLWHLAFAAPVMLVPCAVAYFLWDGGAPIWAAGLIAAAGYIPVLMSLPVALSHMCMPVESPGWMIWNVVPVVVKLFKPLFVWLTFLFVTNIPGLACLGVIGGVYGEKIERVVTTMNNIADIRFAQWRMSVDPKAKDNNKELAAAQLPDVDFSVLIVPGILWTIACITTPFAMLFSMRTGGLFTLYHKPMLKLIVRSKEVKYVSKTKSPEEIEAEGPPKPLNMKDSLTVAAFATVVCVLLGAVAASQMAVGVAGGIVLGLLIASTIIGFTGLFHIARGTWDLGPGHVAMVYLLPIVGVPMSLKRWNDISGPVVMFMIAVVLNLASVVGIVAVPELQTLFARSSASPAGAPVLAPAPSSPVPDGGHAGTSTNPSGAAPATPAPADAHAGTGSAPPAP